MIIKSGDLRNGFCSKKYVNRKCNTKISLLESLESKLEETEEIANGNGDFKASNEEYGDDSDEQECHEEDEEFDVMALRKLVRIERQWANAGYLELEKEMLANALFFEEAMAMILKLQNEKSLIEMEANQYRRLTEEKQLHDQEVIHSLRWIVMKHESERGLLEDQFRFFRQKLKLSMEGYEGDQSEEIRGSSRVELYALVSRGHLERWGKGTSRLRGTVDFNEFILVTIWWICPLKKYFFTWCNNWSGTEIIYERLDRCLVSQGWFAAFPESVFTVLPIQQSDHSPVLLDNCFQRVPSYWIRRFEAIWLMEENVTHIVQKAWMVPDAETELCGVPLSATQATPSPAELYPKPKLSLSTSSPGSSSFSSLPIRAPPAVDSDFEFSLSTNGQENYSSSYESDNAFQSDGFVSGEDGFDLTEKLF
ncbi:Protein FLOURY 1-like [Camellia lanceoleosa]|uniref:Protein FLOURY 1-like n=1 Tax=Camellia lanceoleosa TaxID=1840588 RepID=A0ACC0I1I0_9ERIC|nr:Protein FLOURY 1-like [Camellia lanceoleosa]